MKIALFHNLPSGGAKRHTYEQVKELAKRGHELVEGCNRETVLDGVTGWLVERNAACAPFPKKL